MSGLGGDAADTGATDRRSGAADPGAADPGATDRRGGAAEPVATPGPTGGEAATVQRPSTSGGEVRRLDRAPGERYQQAATVTQRSKAGPSRARRVGAAVAVALGTAVATFALITFDIGPGLLVIGIAGGWLTGLAIAGGGRAGTGPDAGSGRAATAAALAAGAIALGLLLDSLRAYALGGVLLPWEYALERFGVVAPLAMALAAGAGALRGR